VAGATPVAAAAGGKVPGSVAHPFPAQGDYSSYLLAARASGAKVICIRGAGTEASNTIKQAHEFGLTGKGLILAVPFLGDSTVRAIGLDVAQDIYWSTPFYWDRDAGAGAFSDRLEAQVPNRRPNKACAAACSGALHYLKCFAALGIDSRRDGRPVASKGSWDTCSIVSTLPADGLYAPLGTGGCKLIRA
jgi:branched-chain amino acid transport system substrate-binding protein